MAHITRSLIILGINLRRISGPHILVMHLRKANPKIIRKGQNINLCQSVLPVAEQLNLRLESLPRYLFFKPQPMG